MPKKLSSFGNTKDKVRILRPYIVNKYWCPAHNDSVEMRCLQSDNNSVEYLRHVKGTLMQI